MANTPNRDTGLIPAAQLAEHRKPPFPGESEAYSQARKKLLAEEIEFRRHMTRLSEQRKALPPGPVISAKYRFKRADGSEVGLRDLFGKHETLISYFWMFGPQRERPCPMCTNWLGGVNGNAVDIEQRAAFQILSRSPVERQLAFAKERGWQHLNFVQTMGDDYAKDIGILDDKGNEGAAMVVYQRKGDEVRLFWMMEMPGEAADPGQDPRVAPDVPPLWTLLDFTPEGRAPDWYPKLRY
jgi:predicted dithiol-disulfide oxidoreductase (DUF899 family)